MSSLDYRYIARLVEHAQMGDSDAFAELYAATYQRQYRFACRYLNDEYLAQDALQETYILALKNLTKLKDSSLFIAWLNQINFRVCYNLHKKQTQYRTEMANLDNADSIDLFQAAADSKTPAGPEDLAVEVDSQEYLMAQILKLPFTEAQVIILKYFQNMSHGEIAELMDISKSSVKRYLSSGHKHLKKTLAR